MKIIAYRGQKDNRTQDINRQSNHMGIYFSCDPKYAKKYGDIVKKYEVELKNPLILKDKEWNLSVIPEYYYRTLISKGYDGGIWVKNNIYYEIVVFDKNCIKKIFEENNNLLNKYLKLKEASSQYWDKGKSINAQSAESDGRFPKTEFIKRYGIDPSKIVDPTEWHHSSKYFNKVDYYSLQDVFDALWELDPVHRTHFLKNPKFNKIWVNHKKEIAKQNLQTKLKTQLTVSKKNNSDRIQYLETKYGTLELKDPNTNELLFKSKSLSDKDYKTAIDNEHLFVNKLGKNWVNVKGWRKLCNGIKNNTINESSKKSIKIKAKVFQDYLIKKYDLEYLYLPWYDISKYLYVSLLKVKREHRKKGIGTKVMDEICEFADKHNIIVGLTPEKVADTPKSVLINFYKKFGFYKNTGRYSNSRISAGMIRNPGDK